MTKSPPRCRYCGKPIAKRTKRVWLRTEKAAAAYPQASADGDIIVPALPTSIAECRKMTNSQVISVSYARSGNAKGGIDSFNVWDGESYVDPFFCNGEHARALGYLAAKRGMGKPDV